MPTAEPRPGAGQQQGRKDPLQHKAGSYLTFPQLASIMFTIRGGKKNQDFKKYMYYIWLSWYLQGYPLTKHIGRDTLKLCKKKKKKSCFCLNFCLLFSIHGCILLLAIITVMVMCSYFFLHLFIYSFSSLCNYISMDSWIFIVFPSGHWELFRWALYTFDMLIGWLTDLAAHPCFSVPLRAHLVPSLP